MNTSTSGSLFDDEPAGGEPAQTLALVSALAQRKHASKAHQRFAKLVARIELRREQLGQWQAYVVRYNQRLASEMEPLRLRLRHGQRQMILLADELLTRPAAGERLGRSYQIKLQQLVGELFRAFAAEDDDEVLRAVRSKYLEELPEEDRRAEVHLTEAMLRDVFDLDMGDDHGATSAEELLEKARRTVEERQAQEELAQETLGRGARRGRRPGERPEQKGAESAAARLRREQAAKEVSQSLREVYRKLASALHPDREPDERARERKTLQMQRVNQAYEANDLLTLLGLQLEIEQIDANHLAAAPPKRLAHYVQILTEQLAELELELERCEAPFRQNLHWPPGRALSVTAADQQLSADIAQLRLVVRGLEQDLVAFRDPRQLRDVLRNLTLEEDVNEIGELDEFAELMAAYQPRAPRGRSRR
jgi:hypothetical protein